MGNGTTLVSSDRSDVGCRRAINQDSRAIIPPSGAEEYRRRGWLLIVADGMGAHAAGEEASRIAVERVPILYGKLAQKTPPEALLRALQQTNAEIHDKGEAHHQLKGMGTTCTVLVLVPRGALVGHVGDSRAYRIRGRTVEQLSRDHSWAWECGLSPKEAESIPKNIITRSMGPHPEVEPDIEGPFPVQEGDIFLLCSDGLSGQVADAEIGLLASRLRDPARATEALVGLTLARGAPDNVTVVIGKAGPEEVTKVYAKHEPWPLTDAVPPKQPGSEVPWRPLAVAAVCFFVALLVNPWSDLVRSDSDLVQALSRIGATAALLATVIFLIYAILSAIAPEADASPASSSSRSGRGPHRSADCTPTVGLLNGLAASIDTAASGVEPEARDRARLLVTQVRELAAHHRFDEAVAAAGEALSILAVAIPRKRMLADAVEGDSAADRPDGDG